MLLRARAFNGTAQELQRTVTDRLAGADFKVYQPGYLNMHGVVARLVQKGI